MIRIKRVYEDAAAGDGARFLIERLWPRGMRKADLKLDQWIKEAGPSSELRKWFSHDAAKWAEFQKRYRGELDGKGGVLEPILAAAEKGDVTLLFSSRDSEHNNAVVLAEYLRAKSR